MDLKKEKDLIFINDNVTISDLLTKQDLADFTER